MNFLCDVHISYKICSYLKGLGFTAIHVNEILDRWYTKDSAICDYADKNDLILVSKDADFKNSFFIHNTPKRLIKINLGNISTRVLIELLSENMVDIEKLNSSSQGFILEIGLGGATFIKK